MNETNNGNLIMESLNNLFLLLANNPSKTERLFEDSIIKFPLLVPFYKKNVFYISNAKNVKCHIQTDWGSNWIYVARKIELKYWNLIILNSDFFETT